MVDSLFTPGEERKAICVFLEHERGRLVNVSKELLSKGRELADEANWPLLALLIGYRTESIAKEAISFQADEVWVADDPLLESFSVDGFTKAAFAFLSHEKPSVLLFGATPNGRDLAGRLAVRLRTGLNADCTDLSLDVKRGVLIAEVSGFGGGILAILEAPKHRPQMATVRSGVFIASDPVEGIEGTIHNVSFALSQDEIRTRCIEAVSGQTVDLTQAEVLICGGRGVEGNFKMLEALAEAIGGEVGATRPPVDEGHIERERQIGQTGVIARPKLTIACGISGAFHFVVGIQESDTVVAINTDPEAPIWEYADFCIVGDVAKIVPVLTQALKARREEAHA
jgi:electron transfer flavoprotein alpha subunit